MDDARAMRRALDLAERGRFTVSPNPMVGCVIVADGRIVGEGWHERAGGAHAEIVALGAAGEAARGATVYVTLEPCAHRGRTPPCADALIAAGVGRVVIATEDPNPVAAGGADLLRAAGVDVEIGLLRDLAERQNEVFLHAVRAQRPFVWLKTAVSLDGRVAAADGTSQWLTGPAARRRAHQLRAAVDAVLVGSGTALADDPQLTVRLDGWRGRQPLRVVLDGRGRTPPNARVFDGQAPTLLCTAPGAAIAGGGRGTGVGASGNGASSNGASGNGSATASGNGTAPAAATSPAATALAERILPDGVEVARVALGPDGHLDPAAVLATLWERGVRSVLVEGGPTVVTSFLERGCFDRVVVHVAPVLLGARGRPAVLGGPATLADAPRLSLDEVEQVGDDAVLRLSRKE